MKSLHYFSIIICLIISGSSCSSEDECIVDDWIGIYSSEVTCDISENIDGVQRDTTITIDTDQKLTITKLDGQTIMMNDGGVINQEISVVGCEIKIDTSFNAVIPLAISEANFILNGDQITSLVSQDISGTEFRCQTLFTREN